MEHADALERLKTILIDDFKVSASIDRTSHLRTDLGLDSLALTDLAFLVKQDFALGADVGPESFRGLNTVGLLADFLARHAP